MIAYICKFCHNTYTLKKKPGYERQYCSKICSNKGRPSKVLSRSCRQCFTPIKDHKFYCSKECRVESKPKISVEERKEVDKRNYENKKKQTVYYRKQIKLKALEYKGGSCQSCEYNKCINALEFHHIDPSKKDFAISKTAKAWEKMKTELGKCVLLCANCHREIHFGTLEVSSFISLF